MSATTRRAFLGGFCCCSAAMALAACAGDPEGRVTPGYHPLPATDEGGLWQMMDKAESDIKTSRSTVRDPALNAYVREVACRLAEGFCSDFRVYILRTPHFNASMAPNGMMQVWTGLLLRTQNEAQLAAILGHELGHYLERHTLQRWRSARLKTDIAAFLSLGLSAAGFGQFNDITNLITMASIFAFNRQQEREADAIGFDLMSRAGYPPIEASRVWEQLVAEQAKAKDKKNGVFFFASHPDPEERMATLREKAAASGATATDDSGPRYREHVRAVRSMLLADELQLRQYERSLVVFETIAKNGGDDGELAFYTGEVYRLRDEEGDAARAREAYERALAHADCPPEVHRSLGLMYRRANERDAADAAFRRYLELRPDARDREIIRYYLGGAV